MSVVASPARRRRLRERQLAKTLGPSRVWIVLTALLTILTVLATVIIAGLILGLIWFGKFVGALPPPDQLAAHQSFLTTKVLSGDGVTLLYEITDPNGGRRTLVPLDQIPRTLIEATIATEDAGFFANPGFEIRSIIRAAIDDLTQKQIVSGASTITQQVVRNVLLTPNERSNVSALRKVREVILAYQLTQTYSKADILQIYLNEIPYGNRSFGIEAAAEGYFGKPAANLDLAESALLAGLPQAPSFYNPYIRFSDVKDRQLYVLQRMVDQGYITSDEAYDAGSQDLHFVDPLHDVLAPHFVAYVSDILAKQLGSDRLFHGGNAAITTLDVNLERSAQAAIASNAAGLRDANANNVAVVALDPRNGRILAMVGSANYDDSTIAGEVNMARARRQSGGILSPITYALALSTGETLNAAVNVSSAATAASDTSTGVHPAPETTSIRDALGRGLEPPASHMMLLAGNQKFLDALTNAGVSDAASRVDYSGDQSISGAHVSPLEVAQLYAALADGGLAHPPVAIDRVVDQAGQTVWQPGPAEQVALDPNSAYLVSSVLADPAYRPVLRDASPDDAAVAAHTAFSDNKFDSWAAGYDSSLVLVVWVGNASGFALRDSRVSAAIWENIFQDYLSTHPAGTFEQPPDVVAVDLCANPGCTIKRSEYVVRGTEAVAQASNLKTIAKPVAVISNSRTPLVDRGKTSSPSVSPAVATVGGRSPAGKITVPDVARMSPDQARQRLAADGLTNATQVQYMVPADLSAIPKDLPSGQVASTIPAAGVEVQPGTSVVLVVRPN